MTTNRRSAGVMGVVLAFDQRTDFDGLRRSMLMLLGVWIAYFVIVEAFIRTLGRIIVPIVNVPLSAVLVGARVRAALPRRALSARAARARSIGAALYLRRPARAVMAGPAAGRVPAIHVLSQCKRRGWP